MGKIHFLQLKGSEWFIMYDGLEDKEMNGHSISITANINYAQKFSSYEAGNHILVKEGICNDVFIDMNKSHIDKDYIQLSIFD